MGLPFKRRNEEDGFSRFLFVSSFEREPYDLADVCKMTYATAVMIPCA
jgi:hypothetical protein